MTPTAAKARPAKVTAAPALVAPSKPTGGGTVPVPTSAAPPVTTATKTGSAPAAAPASAPKVPVYTGTFGLREAQRLLWRAGFGPKPGQAEQLAAKGLVAAVRSLTRPTGTASLVGAAPTVNGKPLAPSTSWGHDHLWWLDRMVRSDQPLVERMTLVWHDWFATSNRDVDNAKLMIAQNETLRRRALGSFTDLAADVTVDPAMLVWLSGIANRRQAPNENYAREYMELFTLGADRGAYTETDVRTLARAFTGWVATWTDGVGFENFRFDPSRADTATKTLWAGTSYARTGPFGWRDAARLCLENPYHRSFFVLKLWSYFVPSPPSASTQAALESLYESSGRSIAQVVEAILLHPDLYQGAPLVKPPVVYNAGLLRAFGQAITDDTWYWRGEQAGQRLFLPPNVSGWNDRAWLDTSSIYGRWFMAQHVLRTTVRMPENYAGSTETPEQAVAIARAAVGNPALTTETSNALLAFAQMTAPLWWGDPLYRAHRQNALRQLIASSPDGQVC